jgi:hypothetical protein
VSVKVMLENLKKRESTLIICENGQKIKIPLIFAYCYSKFIEREQE